LSSSPGGDEQTREKRRPVASLLRLGHPNELRGRVPAARIANEDQQAEARMALVERSSVARSWSLAMFLHGAIGLESWLHVHPCAASFAEWWFQTQTCVPIIEIIQRRLDAFFFIVEILSHLIEERELLLATPERWMTHALTTTWRQGGRQQGAHKILGGWIKNRKILFYKRGGPIRQHETEETAQAAMVDLDVVTLAIIFGPGAVVAELHKTGVGVNPRRRVKEQLP
jgi:hypothetical protein